MPLFGSKQHLDNSFKNGPQFAKSRYENKPQITQIQTLQAANFQLSWFAPPMGNSFHNEGQVGQLVPSEYYSHGAISTC
jgi:hypothetical protein